MTLAEATEQTVRSADGTTIAYEVAGSGPALVFVDAAGGYRELGPMRGLAAHLVSDFTTYVYDRRGRGASGDTPPWAVEREVEDLGAIIAAAGGSAFVHGFSSGSLLAIHGVARGLPIRKLSLLEPPVDLRPDRPAEDPLTRELAELVAAGRLGDAAEHFNRSIGVPDEFIDRAAPWWPAFESVAHTLVHDCRISDATTVDVLRLVTVPTLVIDSTGSTDDLTGSAATIVDALPNATRRSLTGEWHGVPGETLAPVLEEWFLGRGAGAPGQGR
jgi:pimeloyl-ACP methyl ester carboxylesterase